MNFYQPPFLLKKIFNNLVWNIPNDDNKIFLTFDDCSDDKTTEFVLKKLEEYKIYATFFCTGKYIENNNFHLIIKNSGHSIGNHGFEHINGFKTKTNQYIENIEKCDKFVNSNLYRPPYGKITPKQINLAKKKYKIIMWDIMTYDFENENTPENIIRLIHKKARTGSIIVFHTNSKSKKNLTKALPESINYLKKNNFEISKIEFE